MIPVRGDRYRLRAALFDAGLVPPDATLPRLFDHALEEDVVVTLSGPDGRRVASLEVRRVPGIEGLHLVLRYPEDHKAYGSKAGPPVRVEAVAGKGWKMDARPGRRTR